MNDLVLIKKQLRSLEGIELANINEVTIVDGLFFLYKGQHVLLYIRDQYYNPRYPKREYKYHICNCKTIDQTIKNGRFNRYVVSTRTDGFFRINIRHIIERKIMKKNEVAALRVCKNCLLKLHYHGYTNHKRSGWIYKNFNLREFFSEFSEQFKNKPSYDDMNSPEDEYSLNFKQISYSFRAIHHWICEKCGKNLEKYEELLDTHHTNGIKSDDRYENLECLCVGCHAKKPNHSHIYQSDRFRKYSNIFRR